MKRSNFPNRLEEKREQATARQAAWAALSPVEQLAVLDARLGVGVGATKQRKRIAAASNRAAFSPARTKKAK